MARLWGFSAGLNTLTAGVEFTSGNGSGAITISAFPADATRRALRFNPSAASAWMGQIAKASASSGQFWVGQAIEVGTAPASATEFVGLWNSGAGTRQAGCYIDNSHVVHLRDSTANNRVSSSALSAGIHFVEFTTTVSAGSAAMELVIDGVSIGTFASGTVGNFDAVYWGTPAGAGTYDLYLSEFAINDSSGSNETSWPSGKNAGVATGRRYAYAWPSAAGDGQQWNKQGGGAASSTNYQDVDETTPDDATTYLRRTTTGAKVDDYNLPSAASLGIGASDTIRLIQVGARVGSTSTTATGRNYATRIKSQASGTVLTGATAACNVNGWTTHVAAAPKNYQLTSYVDPQAGGAWTPSLIDNAQIGITTVTSSTNEIRVSTVWALIEYVVAANDKSGAAQAVSATSATSGTGAKAGVGTTAPSHASATSGTGAKATSGTAATVEHATTATASGGPNVDGAADELSAESATSASGTKGGQGAATPSVSNTATGTGTKAVAGSASVSATTSTSGAGTTARSGDATEVSHESATSATASKAAGGAATASSDSSTAGSGVAGAAGAASAVAASSTTAAAGAKGGVGSAPVASETSLTATGEVGTPEVEEHSGGADESAVAGVTAAGRAGGIGSALVVIASGVLAAGQMDSYPGIASARDFATGAASNRHTAAGRARESVATAGRATSRTYEVGEIE